MDFKIEKKGYSPQQVDTFINEIKRTYDDALASQKERILELKIQLTAAEKEVKNFKEKSSLVNKAILNAVAKAEEIENLSQIKYNQEINQLKAFHDKWTVYYNKILDRYPLDDQLVAAGKFNNQMSKILSRASLASGEVVSVREDKLTEQQIGYIRIKTESEEDSSQDDKLMNEMVPGADLSSPIISGNFDPLERINRYFASEKVKTSDNLVPKAAKQNKEDYADRLPSGFSFEEALNPKEDLSQIMKDLGLLLDE